MKRARLPGPLARLDIAAFVDLVRQLRSAQVGERARFGAPAEARALERLLDDWLLELDAPPALPVVWPTDAELAGFAASDDI